MTRVVHFIPTLHGGGAEKQVTLLAPALVKLGADTHLCARFTDAELEHFTAEGVICHPLPNRSRFDPRRAWDLCRVIRRVQPDIVQCWLTPMIIWAGFSAWVLRVPWVLTECSSPQCYRGPKEWARQAVGRTAAAIVANSAAGLSVWPRHRNRHKIPNGIDTTSIDTARGAYRKRGEMLLVAVARLVPEKRVATLLRAFAVARISNQALRLVVIGDGPERASLEAAAGPGATLLGHRNDVAEWLKSADAFVSASTFEGQPNAVLEAMAAGLPLILSAIPEHQEIAPEARLFVDARGLCEAMTQITPQRRVEYPSPSTPWRRASQLEAVYRAQSASQPIIADNRQDGSGRVDLRPSENASVGMV